MPLGKIKEYAQLSDQGDGTAGSRMELLVNHATALDFMDHSKSHLSGAFCPLSTCCSSHGQLDGREMPLSFLAQKAENSRADNG